MREIRRVGSAFFLIACNALSPNIIVNSQYGGLSRRDALISTAISSSISSSSSFPREPRKIENNNSFRYDALSDIDRIVCLSDLHTDHPTNFEWIETRANILRPNDLLILAGDISHQTITFQSTLRILRQQCRVVFVPGNHEAWLETTTSNQRTMSSSLSKLESIYDLCRKEDVFVDPVYIQNEGGLQPPVWILPLESWYDGSLSFDESLCEGFDHWPWVDFARCHWPGFPPSTDPNNARIPQGLVEFFLQRNQDEIFDPWKQILEFDAQSSPTVITVSHFAPNQQCLPDWKDLSATQFRTDQWLDHGAGSMSAKFAKVAGTSSLDQQLRANVPSRDVKHLHVFGHSHRPKDFTFQNIRYIHNPLGKPRERELHMVSPDVTFQVLWEKNRGVVPGPTILRYWEQYGGGTEMLRQRMERVRPGRYNNSR